MYLRKFRIKNYLIHQDTSIDLSPLAVFVGPNGGGKSAFFDALLNFSMLSRGSLQQAFGPFPYSFFSTRYRGAANRVGRIGFEVSMAYTPQDESFLVYEIDYSQNNFSEDHVDFTIYTERLIKEPGNTVLFDRSSPDKYPLFKNISLDNNRSIFSVLRQQQIVGNEIAKDSLLVHCVQQVSRFNKFRLDPSKLSFTSRLPEVAVQPSPSTVSRIGYNGEDLAAVLYHLAESKSSSLDKIRQKVKEIEPQFSDFQFNTVGADQIGFSLIYSDGRQVIPAARLSSGVLVYIGLIALVLSPNRPSILMIEEPENGLTPQAIRSFYSVVRELANNDSPEQRSQVLLSSHSPLVICEAWNGNDRDFIHQVKVVDGKSRIRKVSDIIATHKIQLGIDNSGTRTHLSLKNAGEIMSGYLA